MSRSIRDRGAQGESKRHQVQPMAAADPGAIVRPIEGIPSPFGASAPNLSDTELRQTAYEILVGACRTSGGKALTYIPASERSERGQVATAPAPSLQRSLTSAAASKVKKALGLRPSMKKRGGEPVTNGRVRRPLTTGELIRVQMGVSEQADSRIRRALLRVAAGQLGRRIESIVLPLELLQQFKSNDFPSQQECENWQKRNLKVLEAGLLLHPYSPLDRTDSAPNRLREAIRGAIEKPVEMGKNNETMQVLRNLVMSLACRSKDGSAPEVCHWADGYPFNLRLYQLLLEACFDVNEETSVIEELDEVLELIKKTWSILGMTQMLHNLCFSWVLFQRYVTTGEVENDLLFASSNLLIEIEKDAKVTQDSLYSKVLNSALSSMLSWAEKKLLAYRDTFNSGNIETMQGTVSLAVSAAKMLVEDIADEYHRKRKDDDIPRERVDTYIRSSLRTAFAQKIEKLRSSKRSSRNQQSPLPSLAVLAHDISELAINEKAIFSPILKRWHPLAAGVAVATLHANFANELKKFVSGVSELTPDAIQVLKAADMLEKDLVQIAVQDSVDSEDGGKSVIREMPPFEAEAVIANLVKSWMKIRLDRLKEWLDRNLQQEVWNPRANKEQFAPSAVEVLRMIDETLEAFFLLPIPLHAVLLPELMTGLDKCLQNYIIKAKAGCGTRTSFMPTMPALTRCKKGSKFRDVFKRKEKSHAVQRKPQTGIANGDNSFGVPQLCVRINTLHHIRTQLDLLEKRTLTQLRTLEPNHIDDIANSMGKRFEPSAAACFEGIQQLCEATAYRIIFHDLSHVLWDSLYVGETSSSRIEPFLQELEQYLEIIASTVHDRVRTRLISDVMKASFEGFLLVLLAGGPSRAFTRSDYDIIEEDFKCLTDLFWSNGDGLPADLIGKCSVTVKNVLPMFCTDAERLIEQFRSVTLESYGNSAKSRLPLPPTSGNWNPNEANTLLRVLCYRNDEAASKFLKKTYNLPTKL